MSVMFYVLDGAAIATALIAAWFWYQAGARSVRRISRFEERTHPVSAAAYAAAAT